MIIVIQGNYTKTFLFLEYSTVKTFAALSFPDKKADTWRIYTWILTFANLAQIYARLFLCCIYLIVDPVCQVKIQFWKGRTTNVAHNNLKIYWRKIHVKSILLQYDLKCWYLQLTHDKILVDQESCLQVIRNTHFKASGTRQRSSGFFLLWIFLKPFPDDLDDEKNEIIMKVKDTGYETF